MATTRRVVQNRRARRQKLQTGFRLLMRRLLIVFLSIMGVLVLALLTGVGSALSAYGYYAQQLPDPDSIQNVEQEFSTVKLYDRTGTVLLYEIVDPLGGDRTWVEMSDIPASFRDATVAIEDKTFYTNPGYDAEGIARALYNNLTGGQVQGGSSITQQLVKNVLIEPSQRTEVSFDRKIRELILAIQISREFSKDQILEWYLNTNFYGNLAYGAEAAAQVYFGKHISELTLAESSMLAAIPQSPALNPIDNYDIAKERQRLVLDFMVEQGYVTAQEADIAFNTPLTIQPPEERFDILAPHFSISARRQLEEILGPTRLYQGGWTVYTTLDYDLYLQSECAARSHIARLSGQSPATVIPAADGSPCTAADYLHPVAPEDVGVNHNANNAAIVVMNAKTGEVLSMIGSLDYHNEAIDGNFNVALAERQPGSAFKPFTYLTAFQQGYAPATMTLDVRTAFNVGSNTPYVPENFDRQFHGPQSIRTALANSYNVPAVEVLQWVGIDNVIHTAHAMGINTLDRGLENYGLSLTLGGGEVNLFDLTYAYSTLANMGEMTGRPTLPETRRPGYRTLDPTMILRVEDKEGNIIWEYGEPSTYGSNPVVDPALTYLINDILSDDVARRASVGTNSALLLDRTAAVKTGTTNDYRDNLTVGYTPQIVTGVWIGNTDNTPMIEMPAIVGAAPIWKAVMQYAHRDLAVENWVRPSNVVEMTVCHPSGLLPTQHCPTKQELFVRGTEPITYDNIYQVFKINKNTGKLATSFTEPELVEEKAYQILPDAADDWVREQGIEQPPTEYDPINTTDAAGDVAITEPLPFAIVRGAVVIRGNARDRNFQLYNLFYGEGINPTSWTQIGSDRFTPAFDFDLGIWDARLFDGLFTIRLTVVRGDNRFVDDYVQVNVDNTPPEIRIISPQPDQVFTMADEFIQIAPFTADNISMDYVEFYVDDQPIAKSTIYPYNERWFITEPGVHTIQLRAFDVAGNETESERVTIVVNP